MHATPIGTAVLMGVILSVAPLLMVANPPMEDFQIYTRTQTRVIEATHRHGVRFVEFDEILRFFASSYGCRNGEETAYIVLAVDPRRGMIRTGFCVADGENGAIRPAPMRRVAGSYPVDNDDD